MKQHLSDEEVERLVLENQGLAYKVASAYRLHSGADRDDLNQAALIGLFEAARKYDPDRGKFSSYAWWWCRYRVQQAWFQVRAPVSVRDESARVFRAEFDDDDEWNAAVHMGGRLVGVHDGDVEDDILSQLAAEKIRERMIEKIAKYMTDHQAVVVRLYHGIGVDPMTIIEIAKVMGVSRQAIHVTVQKATERLTTMMRNEFPEYQP